MARLPGSAAICLARAYETGLPKKLREISAEMDIPRTFVSQIPALRRPHVTHPGTMVPLTPPRRLTQSGHQRSQPSEIKQLSGDLTDRIARLAEGMHTAEVLNPDPGDACAPCLGALSIEAPGEPRAVVRYGAGPLRGRIRRCCARSHDKACAVVAGNLNRLARQRTASCGLGRCLNPGGLVGPVQETGNVAFPVDGLS
jgi:hypothetical protein